MFLVFYVLCGMVCWINMWDGVLGIVGSEVNYVCLVVDWVMGVVESEVIVKVFVLGS